MTVDYDFLLVMVKHVPFQKATLLCMFVCMNVCVCVRAFSSSVDKWFLSQITFTCPYDSAHS